MVRQQGNATTLYLGGTELTATTTPGVPLSQPATTTLSALRYYSHAGQTLAVRAGASNDTVTTLIPDGQGTTHHQINNATSALTTSWQPPYGDTRGSSPVTWAGDRSFVGGTKDDSGLIRVGARDYDPQLQRFITIDPLQDLNDPLQWNPYLYANNTPITKADPSGLRLCVDVCGGKADQQATAAAHNPGKGANGTRNGGGAGSGGSPGGKSGPSKKAAPQGPPNFNQTWFTPQSKEEYQLERCVPNMYMYCSPRPPTLPLIIPKLEGPWYVRLTNAIGGAVLLGGAGKSVRDPGGGSRVELVSKPLKVLTANTEVGSVLSHTDLNPSQLSNLTRYTKKLPAGAEDTVITRGADGAVQFKTKVPGRAPGSYATYDKVVDASGFDYRLHEDNRSARRHDPAH